MALTFTFDPVVDAALHNGILGLWTDVSNAGGAVGFVPPVTADDIRPALIRQLAAVADGGTRLLVGRSDDDADGAVAATAFLTHNTHHLQLHWLWAYTVMVHPRLQGRGHGRALMDATADAARSIEGIDAIRLGCRGGLGLERFYEACGYREVGRVPRAIRVAPGDDRDDITMLLPLH
ncbi:GNAT family N-acetyltransferase [Streptomyces xanthophaeus]|uniref:GNAT family N-acetyltransferase n=1 Tax=Streptomyces xanthophaeus TaxID=67385 RepID=UPI0038630996|nr:GNAT family N-acetyltransferase [Streptomyces xanthophaeus]WST61002.1 GNAT family N-acetyltransferase [Streptomyces xanthophaeus]